jgi:Cellulase (glycosyl hydrolase family 5)
MSWFRWRYVLYVIGVFVVLLVAVAFLLSYKPVPERVTYGMSFTVSYAEELGLDWRKVYDALLDDLGVRHLRLSAHWTRVESEPDTYSFAELDYQIERAEAVGAEVVLAVGRRLPRWPECHVPSWATSLEAEAYRTALLSYVTAVVERYKDSPAVVMWQVENEPFLRMFAFEHCGELDVDLLDAEIALVRSLDPQRPVLVTDSGNLGTWRGAYSRGDVFGTSVYVHFWNPELGQFRTVLPPAAYRVKERLLRLWYGFKPTVLIELSAEPWLITPVIDTPLSVQFSRMDVHKFNDILSYARATRYDRQYLWGGEWWYWLKTVHDHEEMWERGRLLFAGERMSAP